MSIEDDPRERERSDLYAAGIEAYPHVPDLADRWLAELLEDGSLPDVGMGLRSGGRQLLRPVPENPANLSSDPRVSHAVLKNGQTLWVRRASRRTLRGYRPVGVVDRPNRTTKATLAALTVLEGRKTNPERLAAVLPLVDVWDQHSIGHSLYQRLEDAQKQGENGRMDVGDLVLDRPLQYAYALLRYYRPGFDELPEAKRRELLQGCCERINRVLDSTQQLAGFLEYGASDKDQKPGRVNPRRDVEAAMMREVEDLKYREIAEQLGVEISKNSQAVGDYSTVSKMVQRGRDILECAYGHDGWDELSETMRQELAEWKELSAEEQTKELSPRTRL